MVRTGRGLEARLQIIGLSRFFAAAFLGFWLAGWAIGEIFVCRVLTAGAWSLFTTHPTGADHQPLTWSVALPAGLFLLVWLSFWTLGGLLAGRQLLRLLFARDILLARPDALEITSCLGLFRSVKRLSREQIRRFYRVSPNAPLCAETTKGMTIITRLGTVAERADLEQALNAEFGLQTQPAPTGALPKSWSELLSPEHESVLVKDPALRHRHARTAWILCAVLSFVPLWLLTLDRQRPDLLAALLFFFVLASGAGAGAVWLTFGRNEWRLDRGRILLQRRFGQNCTTRFEAVSLELVEDNSNEGPTMYVLAALAAGAQERSNPYNAWKQRRTIYSQAHDPIEARNFGVWLGQRCQIPFADLTTPEAKSKDLELLKQHLADSGRFGRVILRIVNRLAPSSPAPSKPGPRACDE